ncbi:MAG: hypothetical protein K9K93_01115 [Acholeplasmataceae bacterium]|nr:hypothetical protein [Acholeplasmataceae bacterium]
MWWNALSFFEQMMFVTAVTATLIMIVFIILMIIGMDGGQSFDGMDVDVDDIDIFNDEPLSMISGLRILSIRGVLAFFSVGGWLAFIFADTTGPFLALVIGAVGGSAAAILLAIAFRAALRLESSGNTDYRYAIGKPASVYIKIPANRQSHGKVTMTLQNKFVEVEAVTDDSEDIVYGTPVKVIALADQNTLVVSKIKS